MLIHFDLQDLSLTILLKIEQKIIFGLVLVGLKGYLPSIGEARSCKSGIDTRGGDWGVGVNDSSLNQTTNARVAGDYRTRTDTLNGR